MTESLRAIDVCTAEMEYIYMGITGNFDAYSSCASSAATIAGVAIFYVKQLDGQQVVQPNKDVIQMPTLGAFARLINSHPKPSICSDLYLRKKTIRGKISASEAAEIGMPQVSWFLTRQDILENTDESNYVFTIQDSAWYVCCMKTPTS